MGAGNAGKDARILVKDDSSSYGSISSATSNGTDVQGAQSVTFNAANETLDVTDFQDEGMDNIKGLQNPEVTIDGNFDGSNSSGQAILLDDLEQALSNDLHVAFLPDENGSVGFEAQMLVESAEHTGEVDGKAEISYSLVPEGGSGFSVIT